MAKKNWIYVKRGLSEDPKHRNQIGNRIWLFLHIIDRADWETGIVADWRDKEESDDMGMNFRTLQQQRQELDALGYITCQQTLHGQTITIHNWVNPRGYSNAVLNPRPEQEQDEDHGTENTAPYGTVHGTVHPYRDLSTLLLDHNHKSGTTTDLFAIIDDYLHQTMNDAYAKVQPVLKIDESPNIITIGVSLPQPALKAAIASLVAQVSKKKWRVKVIHTPAAVTGANLAAADQDRQPYKQAYETAKRGPYNWTREHDDLIDALIQRQCTPAGIQFTYDRLAKDPYWSGKVVPFGVIVNNVS